MYQNRSDLKDSIIRDMAEGLNPRQMKFVKKVVEGVNLTDSAIIAGYPRESAHTVGSRLLQNVGIIKALNKRGFDDKYIADHLKQHVEDGMGIKPSADTSLRALELGARLRGNLDAPEREHGDLTQNNVYINELRTSDDSKVQETLDALLIEIEALKK